MIELLLTAVILCALAFAFDASDTRSAHTARVASKQVRSNAVAISKQAHKLKRKTNA
jgi:hypothetical protein